MLSHMLINGSVYVLAGTLAGLLSGMIGLGGGIIVVPALLFIFNHDMAFSSEVIMRVAVGSSLAVMLFTSLSSIRAHYQLGSNILWPEYAHFWPGIAIGTVSGGLLANKLPTHWLEVLLGLFLLFVSMEMLSGMQISRLSHAPSKRLDSIVSFLIGCQAGLLGGGGGALIIPYLSYCGLELRKIAAVSVSCTLIVAIIGSMVFIITGHYVSGLPAYTIGYIYWPAVVCIAIPSYFFAPLGAKLTYFLPATQLKYGCVLILLATGISLLI